MWRVLRSTYDLNALPSQGHYSWFAARAYKLNNIKYHTSIKSLAWTEWEILEVLMPASVLSLIFV